MASIQHLAHISIFRANSSIFGGGSNFFTEAGGSIQIFSEFTHTEQLINACEMMKVKKKPDLYTSNAHTVKMSDERKIIIYETAHETFDLIRQIYISNDISFQPEGPKMRLKFQHRGREKLKTQD